MFEVTNRAGLARTGSWDFDKWIVRTPNILFVSTERIQPPDLAEILLFNKGTEIHADKAHLIDRGSFFSADNSQGDTHDIQQNIIPSEIHFSSSISVPDTEKIGSPIQMIHKDTIIDPNAQVYVFANAAELISHPKELVARIKDIKEKIGYGKLLYTPCIGTPHQLAILVYCGVDLFDTIPLILHARNGEYLFPNGKAHTDELKEVPCHCPACTLAITKDKTYDFNSILSHNYYMALSELGFIRNAITKGDFREFTEYRIHSDPNSIAILRYLDLQYYHFQEMYLSICGSRIFAAGKESLNRPEITRFRQRIMERWTKSQHSEILLLLPCSARKPYSESISHRAFRKAILESGCFEIIQEVIVTSPLGIVPRELETYYPANCYDIPVTGHWDLDEKHMVGKLIEWLLGKNKFKSVVINLPSELDFVKEVLENSGVSFTDVCKNGKRPGDSESLQALTSIIKDLSTELKLPSMDERMLDNIISMARFQFGDIGQKLVEGSEIRGRYPHVKVYKNGKQTCSYSLERNMFALTPEGAVVFLKNNEYIVSIDDFVPHGDIMAIGIIDANPQIRIGDDVIITDRSKTRLIGTGIARMSPVEMLSSKRGVAIKTRTTV